MRPWRASTVLTVLTVVGMFAGLRAEPAVAATVRHVATSGFDTGDCVAAPCRTIGYATSQSASADTISVAAGTYAEHVLIDRSVTLTGGGSSSTFIDGSSSGTVMTIGSTSASITVTITRVTIQNGYAQSGAGIASIPGAGKTNSVTVQRSTIANNEAIGGASGTGGSGGAIYNAVGSTFTLSLSSVIGNSAVGNLGAAGTGGGIDTAGTLSIDRSTLSNNQAQGGYGLWGSVVGGAGSGGAVHSTGLTVIMRSTISGNVASGGHGYDDPVYHCVYAGPGGEASGGAIDAVSTLRLVNTTIAFNRAQGGHGGGTLFQRCIGGAGGDAHGGGIRAESNETLLNSTVANNNAVGGPHGSCFFLCPPDGTGSGGGIDPSGGSVGLTNAILARNTATNGPDCDGTVTSGGHNLLGRDASCSGFTGTGDLVNMDPVLGPLQNNGGPTQTMALLDGSPAIDAADDALCAAPPVNGKDQRGVSRPQGPRCDIGAYESR